MVLSKEDNLRLNTSCEKLFLSDSLWLTDFNVSTDTRKDSINLAVVWGNKTSKRAYKGDLKSFLFFSSDKKMEFKILPSQFVVADTIWDISKSNQVLIDSSYISVKDLSFDRENQFFG